MPAGRVRRSWVEVMFVVVVVLLLATEWNTQRDLQDTQRDLQSNQSQLTAQQASIGRLARKVCSNQRIGRIQGNIRADVLTDFMESAALTRLASARADTDAGQRRIDRAAARHYRALERRVRKLPSVHCPA